MSEYPNDDDLARIKHWEFNAPGSFLAFMEFVKMSGHYWPIDKFGWQQDGLTFHVSTGGWSGNEEILSAMQDNFIFWSTCWQEHRRGGHYVFELPDERTYFASSQQEQP